jgi:hypothetical protein
MMRNFRRILACRPVSGLLETHHVMKIPWRFAGLVRLGFVVPALSEEAGLPRSASIKDFQSRRSLLKKRPLATWRSRA